MARRRGALVSGFFCFPVGTFPWSALRILPAQIAKFLFGSLVVKKRFAMADAVVAHGPFRFSIHAIPSYSGREETRDQRTLQMKGMTRRKKNSMDNIKWSTYEHVRYLLFVSTGGGGDCILVGIVPECCCSDSFCWLFGQ